MKYTNIITALFFSAFALSIYCGEKELKETPKNDKKPYTGVIKLHSYKKLIAQNADRVTRDSFYLSKQSLPKVLEYSAKKAYANSGYKNTESNDDFLILS